MKVIIGLWAGSRAGRAEGHVYTPAAEQGTDNECEAETKGDSDTAGMTKGGQLAMDL